MTAQPVPAPGFLLTAALLMHDGTDCVPVTSCLPEGCSRKEAEEDADLPKCQISPDNWAMVTNWDKPYDAAREHGFMLSIKGS